MGKLRKTPVDRKIDRQITIERAARERQATEGEAAPDLVEIGGISFFKPTHPHMWFFNRVQNSPCCGASAIDFAVCIVAALTMPQKEVRNVLMRAIDKGDVVSVCYDRLIAWEIDADLVNQVYVELWKPWVDRAKEAAAANPPAVDSNPAGGGE